MKRAMVSVAVVLAVLLASLGSGNAQASPQVKRVAFTITPTMHWHWWGVTVDFNRDATALLAAGAVPAAGVYLGSKGGATGTAIALAIGLGVASKAADLAVDHGNCLQFVQPYNMYTGWFWRKSC